MLAACEEWTPGIDTSLRRPALRWHGGKWLLAPWIVSNFPDHRTYTETFGGAASVLIRKNRSYAEVYNDLDGCVVNLFQVLRSDRAGELIEALRLTPFARSEFEDAYALSNDPVEEARRLVVRSFMGFGSDGFNRNVRTGFRANANRSGTTPAHDWVNYPDALSAVVARFQGVVIEQRPAMAIIKQHDNIRALHYVDPPYLPETRSAKSRKSGEKYHAYNHELSADDHVELLEFLDGVAGAVVLSGYPSPLYEERLVNWRRIERAALADGARSRTEVIWIKDASADTGVFG